MMTGKNNYILRVTDQDRKEDLTLSGGIKLILDTRFSGHSAQPITATVVTVPEKPEMGYGGIEVGDRVLMHYNVARKDQYQTDKKKQEQSTSSLFIDDEELFYARPDEIFGFIKGDKLIPTGDYCFTEREIVPATTTKSGIFLSDDKPKPQYLKITHIRPDNQYKLYVGDMVIVPPGTEDFKFEFKDNDRTISVLATKQSLILGKVENDTLSPVGEWFHVEREKEIEKIGNIIIPVSERSKFRHKQGIILSGTYKGEKCHFFPNDKKKFVFEEKEIYAVPEDHILCLIEN